MSKSVPPVRCVHDENEGGRHVGWLELYFDLIFVVAIIQLGNVLAADVSWQGVVKFAVVFTLLFWAWLGTTVYFGRFIVDDFWHRILTFAQILAVANMAVLVDGAFDVHAQGFLLSFVANRVILVIMYLRAYRHVENKRQVIAGTAAINGLSAVILLVSAFVPPPGRFGLWLIGFLVSFIPPLFSDRIDVHEQLPLAPQRVGKRLGLFTIIVLGESFIKTIDTLAGQPSLVANAEIFGGLCFVIAASLWWTYFDDVADARIKPGYGKLLAFVYAHLPLTMGITAFGVSTKNLVLSELGNPIPAAHLWLATMAIGISMLGVAIIDAVTEAQGAQRRSRAWIWPRIVSAIALLTIAAFGGEWRAEIGLTLVALVCVAQAVIESYPARRA